MSKLDTILGLSERPYNRAFQPGRDEAIQLVIKVSIKDLILELIEQASVDPDYPEVRTYDEAGMPIIYTDRLLKIVNEL